MGTEANIAGCFDGEADNFHALFVIELDAEDAIAEDQGLTKVDGDGYRLSVTLPYGIERNDIRVVSRGTIDDADVQE